MKTKQTPVSVRPLYEIATEIYLNWFNVHCTAAPYLDAMRELSKLTDMYGCDEGKSIVAYFLCNASSWKGDTARRVKAELNAMLKERG
jgi:hypothetical protein